MGMVSEGMMERTQSINPRERRKELPLLPASSRRARLDKLGSFTGNAARLLAKGTIFMTDTLLTTLEIEPKGTARSSVIWMHGLGADARDFEPIVPELSLPAELGIRFVFPNAPIRPVTVNGGMRMRAWYDVLTLDLPRREDHDGVYASERAIYALLEREKHRGVPAERIVLAGFSQGGAMALHTGLRYPDRLAGILALSCYIPLTSKLNSERTAGESTDADLYGPRRLRRPYSNALRPAKLQAAGESGLSGGMAGLRHGPRSLLGGNPRRRRLAGAGAGGIVGLNNVANLGWPAGSR